VRFKRLKARFATFEGDALKKAANMSQKKGATTSHYKERVKSELQSRRNATREACACGARFANIMSIIIYGEAPHKLTLNRRERNGRHRLRANKQEEQTRERVQRQQVRPLRHLVQRE
jgi:hypothetical protein